MTASPAVLRVAAFTKTYDGRCVLSCPELELRAGSVYAVIGANGSGKSTLAKVLSGLERADGRGWDGARWVPGDGAERAAKVGYMPQKSFAFRLSTEANVLLTGGDKAEAAALMEALGLSGLTKHRAKRLSGGETAKMALARILMGEYDLIILDEPTAAMDMESTLAAEGLIRAYVERTGAAAVVITHNLQQARRVADGALFFRKGELVEQGEAALVLNEPVCEETRRFLEFYG